MKRKLSVVMLSVVFFGTMMASSSISASSDVKIVKEEEPEGLVCTDRDSEGHVSRCWFCNCAKFREARQ